jgi:hypothetical protein
MKILNAVYPSPNLRYDVAAREVVFERLNPNTGDVIFQVPSRETLKGEEHAAAIASPAILLSVGQLGAAAIRAAPPPAKSVSRPVISIVV